MVGQISAPRVVLPKNAQALLDQICVGNGTCGTRNTATLNPLIPEAKPGEPAQPGAPARTVTIADVARFLPARGVLHAEPDGWAVVGVPANYWVDVDPMVADGELLGEAAQVRFTPRAYTFDYGDGSSRTTGTPGTSWADLGQDELTVTSTSHVYRTRAHLDVTVNVVYSADYRIAGGDWVGVAGAVTAPAPDVDTLVVAERTVLTAGDLRP